jgi:hypothetical protein
MENDLCVLLQRVGAQALDGTIAKHPEDSHSKSFHDGSEDKVKLKAQVRCPAMHVVKSLTVGALLTENATLLGQVVFDACWRRLEEQYKGVR